MGGGCVFLPLQLGRAFTGQHGVGVGESLLTREERYGYRQDTDVYDCKFGFRAASSGPSRGMIPGRRDAAAPPPLPPGLGAIQGFRWCSCASHRCA